MNNGSVEFGTEVKESTLRNWLTAWFSTGYLLVTRPDALDFCMFQPDAAASVLSAWPEGRVFDQKQEVRWQRHNNLFAVWRLSEQSEDVQELEEIQGPWRLIRNEHPPIYLWGQYNAAWSQRQQRPTWIEVRIAEPLHYPVATPENSSGDSKGDSDEESKQKELCFARLQQIDYYAPNGAVQFTRLRGITIDGIQKEKKS